MRRASSRADTRRALPPPLRRSARRGIARRMADGKEWSLWWSPFLLAASATSPDGSCRRYQTALPLQGRCVPLLSTPLPFRGLRTVWSACLRATGRRHGPRGEGMRPRNPGRSESDSWRRRQIKEMRNAACSHGYGGDRHGGRWPIRDRADRP